DVRPDLAVQLARAVAVFPEDALQQLEAGRLAVAVHQPVRVRSAVAEGRQIGSGSLLLLILLPEPLQRLREARLSRGAGGVETPPGVREEDVEDERQRRRGPFDVRQDRPHAQRPGAGMYAGPKQSGW